MAAPPTLIVKIQVFDKNFAVSTIVTLKEIAVKSLTYMFHFNIFYYNVLWFLVTG